MDALQLKLLMNSTVKRHKVSLR